MSFMVQSNQVVNILCTLQNSREIVRVATVISKAIIVLFLFSIVFALASALYFLIKDTGNSTRIVKALTWRIGLSFFLFLLLMVLYWCGVIEPHSVAGG
jgi:hypothetical protein